MTEKLVDGVLILLCFTVCTIEFSVGYGIFSANFATPIMTTRCRDSLNDNFKNSEEFLEGKLISYEDLTNNSEIWRDEFTNSLKCDEKNITCENGYLWAPPKSAKLGFESIHYSFNLVTCDAETKIRKCLTFLFVGYALGALIIGYFSDFFGRKPATVVATFGMCLFLIGLSTSKNLNQFTIWYFLQAVCANACTNMQVLLMSEIVNDKQRAIPGVMVNTMLGVTCVVYAWFGSMFPKWYELFRFVGFLSLAVTIIISFLMPRSVKWLELNKKGSALQKQNDKYLEKFGRKLKIENLEKTELNRKNIVGTDGSESDSENSHVISDKNETKIIEVNPAEDSTWSALICSKMLCSRVLMATVLWSTTNITYYGFNLNIDSLQGNLYKNMLYNGINEIVSSFVPIFVLTYFGRIHSQLTWLSLIAISSGFGLILENPSYISIMRWAGKFGAAAMFAHIYKKDEIRLTC